MGQWTVEKLRSGFNRFYNEYNRYPTSHEIDAYPYLPSSRQIQRRFGGLVGIRKLLELSGPSDFTKGSYSSRRAHTINKRAHIIEERVYEYLISRFGKQFVHREYFFVDDKRTRTDFFVYFNGGEFSVDVFYPDSRQNLIGCLNNKMKAYKSKIMIEYPVIFLMMNDTITADELKRVVENKKNKLYKNQHLMAYDHFKEFCASKKRLSIGR